MNFLIFDKEDNTFHYGNGEWGPDKLLAEPYNTRRAARTVAEQNLDPLQILQLTVVENDLVYLLQVSLPDGRIKYAAQAPGDGGKDWGWTLETSRAKKLSGKWAQKFMADAAHNNWKAQVIPHKS